MAGTLAEKAAAKEVLEHREALRSLRGILFANIVLASEIPSPTGGEELATRFLSDRFTEARLNDVAKDQVGNIAGVLPGRDHRRNLLVAAHVDKVWPETDDHTVSVEVGRMSGRGIGDNSLGVAVLATLPLALERLGIAFDANLILLGTTRSLGRGDVAGMRFFLENTDRRIDSALCLEGIELGRLSYSSVGMARGELRVEVAQSPESAPQADEPMLPEFAAAGALAPLHQIVGELLQWNASLEPEIRILLGSVEAGSGYNVPPGSALLRFEIRGRTATGVSKVEKALFELVEKTNAAHSQFEIRVEMIAHRRPGDLGRKHPLVRCARRTLQTLGTEARIEPSVSELSVLLAAGIPALTLGLTRGGSRHSPRETIELDPLFDGLAQLVTLLRFMDAEPGRFETPA